MKKPEFRFKSLLLNPKFRLPAIFRKVFFQSRSNFWRNAPTCTPLRLCDGASSCGAASADIPAPLRPSRSEMLLWTEKPMSQGRQSNRKYLANWMSRLSKANNFISAPCFPHPRPDRVRYFFSTAVSMFGSRMKFTACGPSSIPKGCAVLNVRSYRD